MARPAVRVDAAGVRAGLGLDGAFDRFLAELAALEPEVGAARLPDGDEAAELLARMEVPEADAAEVTAALPAVAARPELWWLLERCRHRLVSDMGGTRFPTPWPDLPRALGAAGRWFYLAVLLATVPDVRRYHADRGVPDEVSWATLADVGTKVIRDRDLYGAGGLHAQDWFTLHFRGVLYTLGRLQFNLSSVEDQRMAAPGGPGLPADAPVLNTHIAETGPMIPAACGESFARARPFFARHLGADCAVAVCRSWLLDEQLAEYLPADSNIVRFQRRFHLLPRRGDADRAVLEFVFHARDPDLAALPRDTTLQRAIVEHLRAGRHWHVRSGWLEL